MLFSRFWYVFLAVAATAGLAAAMLAKDIINDRNDRALEDALRRDRAALDVQLTLEARSRLDRLSFISVDSGFGALLREAAGIEDRSRLRRVSAQVLAAMQSQVRQLEQAQHRAPDLAFAVDRHGRIVAQLGPMRANPPGSSLETYPLVRRILQGYIRDDVWVYDRKVYRMAGRPVMSGSAYAGGILHGYRFDEALVRHLADNLQGASVGFFVGSQLIASHVPEGVDAPPPAELSASLKDALGGEAFRSSGRSGPGPLAGGGRAVYALLPGSAAGAQVGVVIGRPREVLSDATALFDAASQQDVEQLPTALLFVLALAGAGLGLFFLDRERDRPLNLLTQRLQELNAGERERLIIAEWGAPYRRLADLINLAVERAGGHAGRATTKKRKANLDEILGPTPGESGAQPFFGFATEPSAAAANGEDPFMFAPATPPAGLIADQAPPLSPASPPGPPPQRADSLPPKTPPGQPPPVASQQGAPVSPVAAGPATPASPAPPEPPDAPASDAPASDAPAPNAPAPNAPAPAAQAPAAAPADENSSPSPTVAGADGLTEEEAAHVRKVYDEYLATRRKCGESVDSLNYDKFESTLNKTRSQLLAKHGTKRVKFTVYIKDGKAALKASPIRR